MMFVKDSTPYEIPFIRINYWKLMKLRGELKF
jgi:hypothetical protein